MSTYAEFAGDVGYGRSTSEKWTVDVGTTTVISLSASTMSSAVNQPVTFVATLYESVPATDTAVVLSGKPVTIYHYFKGVRYDDVVNKLTDGTGQVSVTVPFTSAGERTYYASFAGDAAYCNSTSLKVSVKVGIPTSLLLQASPRSSVINQQVTFTAYLTRPDTHAAIQNKPVTIYHYFRGVRYDDVVNKLTDGTGQVSVTVPFTSTGVREYYASFAGDSQYASFDTSNWPLSMVVTAP